MKRYSTNCTQAYRLAVLHKSVTLAAEYTYIEEPQNWVMIRGFELNDKRKSTRIRQLRIHFKFICE